MISLNIYKIGIGRLIDMYERYISIHKCCATNAHILKLFTDIFKQFRDRLSLNHLQICIYPTFKDILNSFKDINK